MKEQKTNAMKAYKEAKAKYLENKNDTNWREFCKAKTTCMMLGVRI